jgi:RNA polymerase sigma factor (sigma-70 family)
MTNAVSSSLLLALRRVAADQHLHDLPDQDLLERFTLERDESAFHVLLQRHGPMVLDVCRALLPNQADAEDAFQATFLALARQAGSIRRTASLAGWLYGVAARTAHKARAGFNRRRMHERQAARSEESAAEDLTWREVQQVLHEELSQLSDRYRLPLVLCYLQGRTLDDVAGQLGMARNTLKTRLERGREVLRARLLRRGLGPAAVLLASAWPASARADLPAALLTATAALGMASEQAAGLLSARVAALSEGVTNTMSSTHWKIITAATTVLACVGLGYGGLAYTRPAEKPAGAAVEQASAPSPGPRRPAAEQQAIAALQAVGGRIVFDKSQPGEPVVGVYLLSRQVTDRDFEHLREFKSLKTLVVPGLSGAAMKEVRGLKSLERLRARPEIQAGVKDLAELKNLRELDLEGFEEEGLADLRELKHLRVLRLTPWRATGKGLKELGELKELRRLELAFVYGVPNEERHVEAILQAWSELPHLEELVVLEARVDDAGLRQIARFKSLRMLRLANNKVTDAGLAELKSLKSLRRLSLWHTRVTDAGVADLGKARPDLVVTKDVRDDPPRTWEHFKRITGKVKVLDARTLLFDDGTRIPLNMVAPVGRENGAREAAEFLAQLVRDRTVSCFLVEAQLAYIGYVGDVNIEHAMIIHGWARSHHSGTGPAEAIARENQRGLWGRQFQGPGR